MADAESLYPLAPGKKRGPQSGCGRIEQSWKTRAPSPRQNTTTWITGPTSGIRKPTVYAGVGLAADSLWTVALLVPLLLLMRYGVIAREERYLARKFGQRYLAYKASVRRWL